MPSGPVIGPAPCPQYNVSPINQDGTINLAWYRFWSSLSSGTGKITTITAAEFPTLGPQTPRGFFYVSDYSHLLYWDGLALTFADGGSNFYAVADSNPATGLQTAGNGWHPMDGAASVSYLTITTSPPGVSVQTRALANLISTAAYLKVGAGSSSLNGPIAPTFVGTPFTPAGTNSAPALTMNSFTPAGSISTPLFVGTAATIVTQNFVTTAGTTPAMTSLDGSNTSYTPAGTVSAPGFTGTPATPTGTVAAPVFTGTPVTPSGTISSTGQPENLYSRLWFRT